MTNYKRYFLPEGDSDFSNRWRKIKAGFSKLLPEGERRSKSRRSKGERGIWQRRFWEHVIREVMLSGVLWICRMGVGFWNDAENCVNR